MAIYKPRQHQSELLNFHLGSRCMGTLAWHGMGLGKTLSALWLARKQINAIKTKGISNSKFLVLCPKSAVPTWKAECSSQTPDIYSNMILAPVSQMHNVVNRVKYVDIRMIIIDESHYFKAPDTLRIERLSKLLNTIGTLNGRFQDGRIMCLSGTPMPNGAHEIYTTWALCTSPNIATAAERIMDGTKYNEWKETFAERKLNTFERYDKRAGKKVEHSGSTHRGVQNEEMLNTLLKEFVHFRRVSDCIDLPETVPNYIDLNLPEDKLLADANLEEPEAYMAKLERLSRAKAPYMVDWIKDFIDDTDDQLVVFSMYTKPIREMAAKYKKHIKLITGAESADERAVNIKAFQEGKIRCIAMSYKCGSESLNFQNACHTLYHGYPWTMGMLKQAMARTARQGQQKTTFHHFLTSGHNDQKILNIVKAKDAATTKVEDLLLQNKNIISSLDDLI